MSSNTFDPDRRTLLGMAGAAMLAAPALAAPSRGTERVRLWPGKAPGTTGRPIVRTIVDRGTVSRPDRLITGIADPEMIVCRPARANGTAALVIPGGGYTGVVFDIEGMREAAWLNARGVTAFVLLYRLPAEGWALPAETPLQDAQRAVRLIRARAASYGVRTDRVMVLGFSAGGHLGGMLATRFADPAHPAIDAADAQSTRPDLAALIYPVISMCPPVTHAGSRAALIGADAGRAVCERYSVQSNVTAATPPVFLMHTSDDPIVPVENSLLMYRAMLARSRPVALHLFERGGHGFGVDLPPEQPASHWPALLRAFASSHGFAM